MDRSKVKKIQASQLEILKYVDDVCQKIGINYYLAFGSLLGAIRHQGFIPWDPDIDIVLLRDDYETLRDYFFNHETDKFVYVDNTIDPNHISPHALVINKETHILGYDNAKILFPRKYDGVYIDIFPLDKTSVDRSEQLKQSKRITNILSIITLKNPIIHYGKNWNIKQVIKIFIAYLLKPITFKFLGNLLIREMTRYRNCDSDCYVIPTLAVLFDRIVPFSYYSVPRRVKFEDKEFLIPAKSEEILKINYGDYMKFPPEEERWKYLDTKISKVIYENGLE